MRADEGRLNPEEDMDIIFLIFAGCYVVVRSLQDVVLFVEASRKVPRDPFLEFVALIGSLYASGILMGGVIYYVNH